MTYTELKRLWNIVQDSNSTSCDEIYVIHYIDGNGELYIIQDIERDGEDVLITWKYDNKPNYAGYEDLDATSIYVFKDIEWNISTAEFNRRNT